MNKSAIKWIAVVAILIVLGFLIYPKLPFVSDEKEPKQTDAPSEVNTDIIIDAQVVKFQEFDNELILTGSLLANESVQLASEISGKVDRIYFDEGQYVKKGQILVETNVAELKADLQRLKYTSQLNKETEKRQKQLLERDAISKEEYDIAFTNLKTNEAEMASLAAQIEKSRISSPFSGFVGLRYISEGSYISPTTEIASLYNTNPIKIEFSIPGRYSNSVKTGNEITFTTEASSVERNATVYAIEPQIDPVTRSLTVRAKCSNPENELIPGQFVRISLTLDSSPNTILVPTTAIMPQADGHLVFVVENGQAIAKEVGLGVRTSNKVEILSGLQKGDTVAISGVPKLKDRVAVEIKNLEGE